MLYRRSLFLILSGNDGTNCLAKPLIRDFELVPGGDHFDSVNLRVCFFQIDAHS